MAKALNEDAKKLCCQVMRRCELEKLTKLPLTNRARMGAYAAAIVKGDKQVVAVSLDAEYRPLGSIVLQDGGNALPTEVIREIVNLCRTGSSERVMICASRRITMEDILSLSIVYQKLCKLGITVVDLFEVCGYGYYSVIADIGSGRYPE